MTTNTTNEELDELRSVTRTFLAREVPQVDLRTEPDGGYPYDPAAWLSMAETLGLQGLLVPEEFGGLGFGVHELAVVCEELGRALYNGPYLASAVIASSLLAEGGREAHVQLSELASGQSIAAVVSGLRPQARSATFKFDEVNDEGGLVSGVETFVIGGAEAGLFLVPTATDIGFQIVGVNADALGVRSEALDSIDLLRPIASVELSHAKGRRLIDETHSGRALTIAQLNGTIALAAESVGAAARALEMTVEYVGQRVQFGRVIGSFQSIKHRCADMLVQLEGARSALIAAVNCDGATIDERQRFASLAKVTAADAFYFIASETIHLHGGIGFTWDQPSHLFYRRAKANQLLLGRRDEHWRAIFQSLLPTYQNEGITQ
jgi:alkylation response protein AidB-like acyl-CoA dehydrogenase